jgi:osmotically-inducible protein OsmY
MKTDIELQHDVLEELKWEPSVNAAHIGVAAKDGIVTLSGSLSSFAEKHLVERAAKRVPDVRAVANEISVKLPGAAQRTDEDLARAAADALASSVFVPADQITIAVSKGIVRLEGEVDWQFQKTAAEKSVRYLPGVLGVTSLIAVKPSAAATDVKAV